MFQLAREDTPAILREQPTTLLERWLRRPFLMDCSVNQILRIDKYDIIFEGNGRKVQNLLYRVHKF